MTRFRARCWTSAPVRRRAVWAAWARSRTASPSVGASAGLRPQPARASAATSGARVTARIIKRMEQALPWRMGGSTRRSGGCSLAPGPEEGAKKAGAVPGQHSAADLRPPVAGRLFEEARPMDDRAALGIVGPPDHAADAGVADGPG